MKETVRIKKLFADLYNGSPWLDVTLDASFKKLSAQQAVKKIFPNWNSAWQIINHLISWREAVLLRVQGQVIESPADNYFKEITDQSDAAWQLTLQRLEDSQKNWLAFFDSLDEADLEKIYPGNNATFYENIHGILQHDAYHLGQVVLLSKSGIA